jgi:hypothetical protein
MTGAQNYEVELTLQAPRGGMVKFENVCKSCKVAIFVKYEIFRNVERLKFFAFRLLV